MTERYQVVVVGGGPGGYVAAIRAAQLGFKVACIEKGNTLGGTCLNVGCIPSKALLQSTEYYTKLVKEGKEHGIECKEVSFNYGQMQKRKEEIVGGLTNGIAALFKKNGITRLEGKARLISPQMVEISDAKEKKLIEADNIILATGSEPIALPFLPFDEKMVLSSTGALSLPRIPKKMIVIGGGVIGVELASVYNRLGTHVTIIEMLEQICAGMDVGITKVLLQTLKKQGLNFELGAQVTKAKIGESGVSLIVSRNGEGGQTSLIEAEVVLVSVGRRPFSGGLDLEKVGIDKNAKGFVFVNDEFRTNIPNIFAIGDLIEGVMLAHRSSEEGMAVAEIIAGQRPHLNYMAIPNVVYTCPEVASVGLSEKEAHDAELDVKIGTFSFRGNPRARCAGDTDGLVKVIGDAKTDRLIGLHIIGSHASEMIGEGVIAIEKRMTVTQLAQASHAHPTLSEAIKEAALNALGRTIHL